MTKKHVWRIKKEYFQQLKSGKKVPRNQGWLLSDEESTKR